MTLHSLTLRLTLACAVIPVLSLTARAGDFDSYQPTQREICEMYASIDSLEQFKDCNSVNLFTPLIKASLSADKYRKVVVTNEDFPDWPFPDVYFQNRKNTEGQVKPFFHIESEGLHELNNHHDYVIESISIGYIDDIIILEVIENLGGTHVWHRQMAFTPYSCKGHEGYGDEMYYGLTQTFGWSPAFANDIYQKTYLSSGLCN